MTALSSYGIQDLLPLITLIGLEVALGVDNIISIYVLTDKITPTNRKRRIRYLGVMMAAVGRLLLLFSITWLATLETVLYAGGNIRIGWRETIFVLGGLYLLYKGIEEIYHMIRRKQPTRQGKTSARAVFLILTQIIFLDLVFSLDSIITAIALTDKLPLMVVAILTAVVVMTVFVNPVCDFVGKYQESRIIALLFLAVVGLLLVAKGLSIEINYNYLYVAVGFSCLVMIINILSTRANEAAMRNPNINDSINNSIDNSNDASSDGRV